MFVRRKQPMRNQRNRWIWWWKSREEIIWVPWTITRFGMQGCMSHHRNIQGSIRGCQSHTNYRGFLLHLDLAQAYYFEIWLSCYLHATFSIFGAIFKFMFLFLEFLFKYNIFPSLLLQAPSLETPHFEGPKRGYPPKKFQNFWSNIFLESSFEKSNTF